MFQISYERVASPRYDNEGLRYSTFIEQYDGDDFDGAMKRVSVGWETHSPEEVTIKKVR